ncbi:MAG TPA: hypothetical protein VFS43_34705 [Polyangiaceae bacterium]|nr:hypothetical protein [Polyangiaceae bacterium]
MATQRVATGRARGDGPRAPGEKGARAKAEGDEGRARATSEGGGRNARVTSEGGEGKARTKAEGDEGRVRAASEGGEGRARAASEGGKGRARAASEGGEGRARAKTEGQRGRLRAAAERRLLELPAEYALPPDYSVVTVLHEARALEAILLRYGKDLLSGTKLDRKTPAELGARRKTLEEAEQARLAAREAQAPREVSRLRKESEGLVRDVTAAVRYFLEHDERAQRRVEAIREGASDADRIDDLKRCADLLERHAEALKKADLPRGAPAICRGLASELEGAATERSADAGDAARAQALRNRAYWHLREMMDEIRAAGRYVFRHEPKRLALFRSSSSNARRASHPPPPPSESE